jgi:hypothetical protein
LGPNYCSPTQRSWVRDSTEEKFYTCPFSNHMDWMCCSQPSFVSYRQKCHQRNGLYPTISCRFQALSDMLITYSHIDACDRWNQRPNILRGGTDLLLLKCRACKLLTCLSHHIHLLQNKRKEWNKTKSLIICTTMSSSWMDHNFSTTINIVSIYFCYRLDVINKSAH